MIINVSDNSTGNRDSETEFDLWQSQAFCKSFKLL